MKAMFSVRIRKEGDQVVAYIERLGADPGTGIRIPEGAVWAVEPGMSNLEVFAVCNEVGMSYGRTGFKRVRYAADGKRPVDECGQVKCETQGCNVWHNPEWSDGTSRRGCSIHDPNGR